jgi:hypothetical protein
VHQCISASVHQRISASAHQRIRASVHPCIRASVHPCISAPLHQCISASVHQRISASAHQCISASVHQFISISSEFQHARALVSQSHLVVVIAGELAHGFGSRALSCFLGASGICLSVPWIGWARAGADERSRSCRRLCWRLLYLPRTVITPVYPLGLVGKRKQRCHQGVMRQGVVHVCAYAYACIPPAAHTLGHVPKPLREWPLALESEGRRGKQQLFL